MGMKDEFQSKSQQGKRKMEQGKQHAQQQPQRGRPQRDEHADRPRQEDEDRFNQDYDA